MIAVSHEIKVICNDLFELMEKHQGVINKDIVGQYEELNKKGLKEVSVALRYLVNLKLFEYTDASEYRIALTPDGWEALKVGLMNYQFKKESGPTQIINNYHAHTHSKVESKKSKWYYKTIVVILALLGSWIEAFLYDFLHIKALLGDYLKRFF